MNRSLRLLVVVITLVVACKSDTRPSTEPKGADMGSSERVIPEKKDAAASLKEFLQAFDAENAEALRAALAANPEALRYGSGRVFAHLSHPWFAEASYAVDEKTGRATGASASFTLRSEFIKNLGAEKVGETLGSVHPELRPITKEVSDAVAGTFKLRLGTVATLDPASAIGPTLYICAVSHDPVCKEVERALVISGP